MLTEKGSLADRARAPPVGRLWTTAVRAEWQKQGAASRDVFWGQYREGGGGGNTGPMSEQGAGGRPKSLTRSGSLARGVRREGAKRSVCRAGTMRCPNSGPRGVKPCLGCTGASNYELDEVEFGKRLFDRPSGLRALFFCRRELAPQMYPRCALGAVQGMILDGRPWPARS